MSDGLWRASRFTKRQRALAGQGERGIAKVGHRAYVGGLWDEIGRLQFEYLIAQGLRAHHVLLDIACGSLRGGVHFIPYLNSGNYLGVDKERALIEAGLRQELPPGLAAEKRPELLVSSDFEFEKLSKVPDFALAQSLFTHLPADHIRRCFAKLGAVARPTTRFFATFILTEGKGRNAGHVPHDHLMWTYSRDEIEQFGNETGWSAYYHGDWNHPRGQVIAEYRPKAAS